MIIFSNFIAQIVKKFSFLLGMIKEITVVLCLGLAVWAYQAAHPPPPKLCGAPGGPPVTAPRIKLRDGRHLSYKENGFPREKAKAKIILVHGFATTKHDIMSMTDLVPVLYF
jgi:hypothetical protein